MPLYGRRRALAGGLSAVALPALQSCATTHSTRQSHVAFFIWEGFPTFVRAFRDELLRLGYIEGQNLILDIRQSRSSDDASHQIIEMAATSPDVVVAAALPQALMVRSLAPSLPMVVATAAGLVSNGFAQSLEHPGGNVTGMDELPPGLTGRRLRLLKTAAPQIEQVALLSTTPGHGGHETQLADAEQAAAELGVTVKAYRASSPAELTLVLDEIAADDMDSLVNFQGGLSLAYRLQIIDLMRRRRMPAIYQSRLFVESGGLMALSPDQEEQFRMAARYVDQILRGARAGELPIQHPSQYFLSVNLETAAAIGLALSPSFLRQADER
jgi:putative ABC transport system substrate-binding protein